MLLGLASALAVSVAACHPVHADRIYASDFAAAVPAFAALPADQVLSPSPLAGQRRVFRKDELRRIAKQNSLDYEPENDICFEWPQHALDRKQVETAMAKALEGRDAWLEIAELGAAPAPDGTITFPLENLGVSDIAPAVWRGSVEYAPGRHLTVWARVRVTVREHRVVNNEPLRANEPISAASIREEVYEGPFRREKYLSTAAEVIGMMPRSTVPVGTALRNDLLRVPCDVERGDTVLVSVRIGNTHLESEAVAEEAGARGKSITVRNPKSGRKYRARIEDRDKVLVLPTGLAGLVTEETKS